MEEQGLSSSGRLGTTKICPCRFDDAIEQACARMDFLKKYGEALPESAIIEAVAEKVADNWVEYCDCQKPTEIVGAIHYENNDWYLCTLKNLAVKPERRGYGIGALVTNKGVERATQNPDCKVLATDITYDNKYSIRSFEKAGFETVGEFCWEKGQKPADILHFIRFKPTQDKTCLEP